MIWNCRTKLGNLRRAYAAGVFGIEWSMDKLAKERDLSRGKGAGGIELRMGWCIRAPLWLELDGGSEA